MGSSCRCVLVHSFFFFLFSGGSLLFSSGSSSVSQPLNHKREQLAIESKPSTTNRDVTNPVTTLPLFNPMTPVPTTNPVVNPLQSPSVPSLTSPNLPLSPVGGSWCVASQIASQIALQVALDYACGIGRADCSAIQAGGRCYNPNTIRDHASYAFNSYYQKNPSLISCNFGGTAFITNADPSSGACQYASTSTSSSVLNTKNPSGAAVFGSEPAGPSNSEAGSVSHILPILLTMTCLSCAFLAVNF